MPLPKGCAAILPAAFVDRTWLVGALCTKFRGIAHDSGRAEEEAGSPRAMPDGPRIFEAPTAIPEPVFPAPLVFIAYRRTVHPDAHGHGVARLPDALQCLPLLGSDPLWRAWRSQRVRPSAHRPAWAERPDDTVERAPNALGRPAASRRKAFSNQCDSAPNDAPIAPP